MEGDPIRGHVQQQMRVVNDEVGHLLIIRRQPVDKWQRVVARYIKSVFVVAAVDGVHHRFPVGMELGSNRSRVEAIKRLSVDGTNVVALP